MPDIIIGSCGGGLAALIANQIANSAARKDFLQSQVFHRFLLDNSDLNHGFWWGIGEAIKLFWNLHIVRSDKVPNLFDDFLLNVDVNLAEHSPEAIKNPFRTTGLRAVILGGRMSFGPNEVHSDRGGRKLFQEVFFTDTETAELLKGFKSPIGKRFTQSSVVEEIDVVVGDLPAQAARAGVADPFLMKPVKLADNYYYLTGAIDLYPLEVAHQVADEVLMQLSGPFDSFVTNPVIKTTFRHDMNERLEEVTRGEAAHWVDMTDEGEIAAKYGFDPHPNFFSFSIERMLPEDYEKYKRQVNILWEFGKCRMREALSTRENDKSHLRYFASVKSDSITVREDIAAPSCRPTD